MRCPPECPSIAYLLSGSAGSSSDLFCEYQRIQSTLPCFLTICSLPFFWMIMRTEPFIIRIIHRNNKKDKEARDKTFVHPPTFEQVVEVVEQVRS